MAHALLGVGQSTAGTGRVGLVQWCGRCLRQSSSGRSHWAVLVRARSVFAQSLFGSRSRSGAASGEDPGDPGERLLVPVHGVEHRPVGRSPAAGHRGRSRPSAGPRPARRRPARPVPWPRAPERTSPQPAYGLLPASAAPHQDAEAVGVPGGPAPGRGRRGANGPRRRTPPAAAARPSCRAVGRGSSPEAWGRFGCARRPGRGAASRRRPVRPPRGRDPAARLLHRRRACSSRCRPAEASRRVRRRSPRRCRSGRRGAVSRRRTPCRRCRGSVRRCRAQSEAERGGGVVAGARGDQLPLEKGSSSRACTVPATSPGRAIREQRRVESDVREDLRRTSSVPDAHQPVPEASPRSVVPSPVRRSVR